MKRGHDRPLRAALLLALLASASCTGARPNPARSESGTAATRGEHVQGLRSGLWTEYYATGGKQCEGLYERDVQVGHWTWWYENGQKEMEGDFADERRDGEWKSWYENGVVRSEGRFERGFEEGPWRFRASSGELEREGTFEQGQPALRWTYHDPDGKVRESGNCLAGVRVGAWITRDAGGAEVETLYPFPAGWDAVEERFPDASPKRTGFLRDGVPTGRWNSFHPGGRLRFECTFRGGLPNGRAHAWREDGTRLASGELKEGCIVGTWTFARGPTQETYVAKAPRPRAGFAGEWAPANSAELPGCTAVETWVAEICSPRQPAPIRAGAAPAASVPALPQEEWTGIPARAQPWTEYESRALPELVKLYRTGASHDADEWSLQMRQEARIDRGVLDPAELVGRPLPVKRFTTADGGGLDLDEYRGKHRVLVTILRGFGGQVCVYCAAQTKALAEVADQFTAADTELVVVFPGPASGLRAFVDAYRRTFGPGEKLPYRLLYDTDLALTRALRIEDNIAVPTSIVLDRQGVVRWCHVAKNHADRPAAREILRRIEDLKSAGL